MAVASDEVEPHEKSDSEGSRPSVALRLLLVSEQQPRHGATRTGVECVATLDEALLVLGSRAPDVVAVDVSGQDWLVRLEAIRRRAPHVGLIALVPAHDASRAFDALRAGAHECLPAADLDAVELERVARRALDRRWLSEFLERQVSFLSGVFQCVSPGVAVLDPEGRLVLANRAWQDLAERSEDALARVFEPGQSVLEALDTSPDPGARDLSSGVRLVLEGALPGVRTELLRRPDGEDRWFLVQVDPMPERAGVVLMQADITERKHAEEALRKSELDFRKLLEDLPQSVVVHRDGVCLWVNRAALQMLGYQRPEAVVGRKLASAVHPEDLGPIDPARAGASGPDRPRDVRVVRADGSTALVEVRALEVVYDGLPASLLIGTDVSEHRALTAKMMELDRVSSAGLLATALGHEIKNPLSFVSANVDIALRDAQEALFMLDRAPSAFESNVLRAHLREIRGALQDARQGARRVEAVVSDLKAFSRPEQSRDAPVDIEAVLNAAINMTRNEVRHRARLVRNYFPAPAVRGSEAQLGQVFLNLLTNAADAIAVGDAAHNQISIGLHAQDGRVVVEISDTGSGISPADLPRIFDPFFTTKPVGQGTGLGLAICRNIIEAAGGTIAVESEGGRGTTVRVELLEAESQRPPAPVSTISPLRPVKQALKVLVVDDEPLIGRAVARCLGRQHAVRWVASGREALAFLASETFDVIFLDVMMPDMTGVEVYQRVTETQPEVVPRIAFLTGGAFTPEARDFLEAVPNRQLGKPFDGQQIRDVAQEIVSAAPVRSASTR